MSETKKISDIQKTIDNAEIVHIMFNDKFNKPFVDFLNKNFDSKKHLILCKNIFKDVAMEFPKGENVIQIGSIEKFDLSSLKIKKIICHSLFMGDLINKFYEEPELLKKAYWMIWGGDLYGAKRDEKNDFVRKNFKAYITDVDGDEIVAKEKYGSNPLTFNAGYTFPITLEMINDAKKYRKEKDFIKIQINNSADKTTLEMLDILAKFKDENIKITTILSYGQMDFKDEIIKKGRKIFDDKFEYVDKLMTPSDFAKHLILNDILILNQNRQQGIGNSFASLALGCKVFIKSSVTTYNFFHRNDVFVYDTMDIKHLCFDEFIQDDKVQNQKNVLKFFDDSYLKSLWIPIFES